MAESENGVKEALITLRRDQDKIETSIKEIERRVRDIEAHGCTFRSVYSEKIDKAEGDLDDMQEHLTSLKSKIDLWNGGLAVLVVIVPVIIRMFWR